MTTKLIRPVAEPHRVTSGYGWRTLNDKKNWHDGIDYVNINNVRSVLAITSGKVIYDKDNYDPAKRWTDPAESGGNMIILQHRIHGRKYYVRYLHLSENYVSKGDRVKQGDVIGEYADVGYSFGAHLHFDMYDRHWNKINPTQIMLRGLRK